MFRNQKYLPQVNGSKTQQMVSMSFVGLMFRPWASFSCRSATGRTLRPDIAPAIKRGELCVASCGCKDRIWAYNPAVRRGQRDLLRTICATRTA